MAIRLLHRVYRISQQNPVGTVHGKRGLLTLLRSVLKPALFTLLPLRLQLQAHLLSAYLSQVRPQT